jgi:Spy/CpxP family protein refolding chaperone
MKTKYKITLIAAFAAFFAFSTTMWAQPSDAKIEKKIEHRVEKMKKHLNLTDAQVSQVKAILEESKPVILADHQKMKAATKDQKPALRQQIQADKELVKSKLFAVLTPDQQAKAQKYLDKHQGKSEHEEKEK